MADLKISQFADGGSVQETDEIATNRAGVNTKVFVGSAAAMDVGAGVDEIIAWQDDGTGNPQYPSGDGSEITGVIIDANDLTGNTLASGILTSSLTSVGTISSGVWNGTSIAIANGGTGANTAANARNNLGLQSGNYTPTVTPVTNATNANGIAGTYSVCGNIVTVAGVITIQPTAAALTGTRVRISLPISATFTSNQRCSGTAVVFEVANSVAVNAASIGADTTNNEADVIFRATDTNSRQWRFIFQYRIT